VKKSEDRGVADLALGTWDFIRALSYRDFLSSMSLSLLMIATMELIDYYSIDDWIRENDDFLTGLSFITILPLNHVFYRLEHKRSNNFIGRVLHDFIFFLCLLFLGRLKLFIAGGRFSTSPEDIGSFVSMIFSFVFFAMFYEVMISIGKRVLRRYKWRII
jgi:hypothetical protein